MGKTNQKLIIKRAAAKADAFFLLTLENKVSKKWPIPQKAIETYASIRSNEDDFK